MASGRVRMAMTLLLLSGLLHSGAEAATTYTVGGSGGWTFQTTDDKFYDNEFANITLFVGDTLFFPFNSSVHNVYEVSEADVTNCNTASPITTFNTSNASVVLKTAGFNGFICGKPTHCSLGMHLGVQVSAAAGTPSQSPSAPPSTSTPPPVTSPSPPVSPPARSPSPPVSPPVTSPSPSPSASPPARSPSPPASPPATSPSPSSSPPVVTPASPVPSPSVSTPVSPSQEPSTVNAPVPSPVSGSNGGSSPPATGGSIVPGPATGSSQISATGSVRRVQALVAGAPLLAGCALLLL